MGTGGGGDPSCTGKLIEFTLSSVSAVKIELLSVGVVGLGSVMASRSSDVISGNVGRESLLSGRDLVGDPVSILDDGWMLLFGRGGRRGVKS